MNDSSLIDNSIVSTEKINKLEQFQSMDNIQMQAHNQLSSTNETIQNENINHETNNSTNNEINKNINNEHINNNDFKDSKIKNTGDNINPRKRKHLFDSLDENFSNKNSLAQNYSKSIGIKRQKLNQYINNSVTPLKSFHFTKEEYEKGLINDYWTETESTLLCELVEQFELRWIVIYDRIQSFPKWKKVLGKFSLIELKDRYYSIAKFLLFYRALQYIQNEDENSKTKEKSSINSKNNTKNVINHGVKNIHTARNTISVATTSNSLNKNIHLKTNETKANEMISSHTIIKDQYQPEAEKAYLNHLNLLYSNNLQNELKIKNIEERLNQIQKEKQYLKQLELLKKRSEDQLKEYIENSVSNYSLFYKKNDEITVDIHKDVLYDSKLNLQNNENRQVFDNNIAPDSTPTLNSDSNTIDTLNPPISSSSPIICKEEKSLFSVDPFMDHFLKFPDSWSIISRRSIIQDSADSSMVQDSSESTEEFDPILLSTLKEFGLETLAFINKYIEPGQIPEDAPVQIFTSRIHQEFEQLKQRAKYLIQLRNNH